MGYGEQGSFISASEFQKLTEGEGDLSTDEKAHTHFHFSLPRLRGKERSRCSDLKPELLFHMSPGQGERQIAEVNK